MKVIYKSEKGRIVHGDNLEALDKFPENSIDSCISDFPYDLSFMERKWDTTGNFYDWCKQRAEKLHKIMKPGGYVCIFGHPKTNHRMKCAFEDVGFNVVEEIDSMLVRCVRNVRRYARSRRVSISKLNDILLKI